MVHCFMALGLGSPATQLLWYKVYGGEVHRDDHVAESVRQEATEAIQLVVDRVSSEAQFALKTPKGEQAGLTDTVGAFRLPKGHPYSTRKVVHWQRDSQLVYAIVRDPDENALLAENAVATIAQQLRHRLRSAPEVPQEVAAKPEELGAVLHMQLPNGLLQFASTRMSAQLYREADLLLSKK